MSEIPVVVKHAGKTYDVDVDPTEPGLTFKMQLFSLTGVPPERQKILVKGGQVRDDQDLTHLKLQPKHTFMLLGTAGDLPKPPPVAVFAEDMTDLQRASVTTTPNGLVNLGNTCYANSTLQALRVVPELKESLEKYKGNAGGLAFLGPPAPIDMTAALRDLYKSMGSTTRAYSPQLFIELFRRQFPQFDERDNQSFHKQQDAEEAWSQMLTELRPKIKIAESGDSFVDRYFGGNVEVTVKCTDPALTAEARDAQETTVSHEPFLKLDCHISISTNFLRDGLLAGLKEVREQHNAALGRDAQYTLEKRITRLPKYLTVHYIRFFWRRDTQKKSKILRKVEFPFQYDATELCSEGLRKKLVPARDRFREVEKEKEELVRSVKRAKFDPKAENSDGSPKAISADGTVADWQLEKWKEQIKETVDPELATDPSCNPLGLYELAAIVTHGGASADSGHYQCFARSDKDKTKWWRFNDDKVTEVDEAKIETLSGGGESDSALILLYRAVDL